MEQNLYICYNKNTKVMNVQADIKWISQELKTVKDPTLIEAFKNMLKYREKVAPKRISVEQYNKELDEAEADIEAGNYYTTDEARKIASQW